MLLFKPSQLGFRRSCLRFCYTLLCHPRTPLPQTSKSDITVLTPGNLGPEAQRKLNHSPEVTQLVSGRLGMTSCRSCWSEGGRMMRSLARRPSGEVALFSSDVATTLSSHSHRGTGVSEMLGQDSSTLAVASKVQRSTGAVPVGSHGGMKSPHSHFCVYAE